MKNPFEKLFKTPCVKIKPHGVVVRGTIKDVLRMLIACAMVLERSGFDSNMLKEALKELKRRESDGEKPDNRKQ
jgi:hypothetical protein